MMGSPSVMKPSVRMWSNKANAVAPRVGSRGEYAGLKDKAAGCTRSKSIPDAVKGNDILYTSLSNGGTYL
eukprot:9496306-Pyramimonas_sp.AAC.3